MGPQGPAILEAKALSKRFGGLAALTDYDLELKDGDVLGLIGPNGAGKTTAFNLLTGVLRPTSGRVALGGAELAGTKSRAFRTDWDRAHLPEHPPVS